MPRYNTIGPLDDFVLFKRETAKLDKLNDQLIDQREYVQRLAAGLSGQVPASAISRRLKVTRGTITNALSGERSVSTALLCGIGHVAHEIAERYWRAHNAIQAVAGTQDNDISTEVASVARYLALSEEAP